MFSISHKIRLLVDHIDEREIIGNKIRSSTSPLLHCECFFVHVLIKRRLARSAPSNEVVVQFRWNPHFPHKIQPLHRSRPRGKPWVLVSREDIDAKHADSREPLKDRIKMKIGQTVVWPWDKPLWFSEQIHCLKFSAIFPLRKTGLNVLRQCKNVSQPL